MKMSFFTLKMDDKRMKFYEILAHEYNLVIHNYAPKTWNIGHIRVRDFFQIWN